MIRLFCILFLIIVLASCSGNASQEEIKQIKSELDAAKATIADLKSQFEPEGELVHLVFFKLKPNANHTAFVAAVKKIEAINEVMDLEVGPFEDLGDARAMSDFSMLMQMSFKNNMAYEIYQKHPIHLALKENLKSFLNGPPVTYDFMKK